MRRALVVDDDAVSRLVLCHMLRGLGWTAEQAADVPEAAARVVLIAEDNPTLRFLSTRLVAKLGHAVSTVPDGAAAVTAVTTGDFDVVLMDVHMPVMGGLDATRRIRAEGSQRAQPHIVALTAGATTHDRDDCLAAGMDDYISKPFTLQDLHRAFLAVEARPAPRAVEGAEESFAALDEFGPEVKAEVLRAFAVRGAEDLLLLERAVAAGEAGELRFLAHRLRGSSLAIGATALAEACLAVETAPDDEVNDHARLSALRDRLDAVVDQIEAWTHARPPA